MKRRTSSTPHPGTACFNVLSQNRIVVKRPKRTYHLELLIYQSDQNQLSISPNPLHELLTLCSSKYDLYSIHRVLKRTVLKAHLRRRPHRRPWPAPEGLPRRRPPAARAAPERQPPRRPPPALGRLPAARAGEAAHAAAPALRGVAAVGPEEVSVRAQA